MTYAEYLKANGATEDEIKVLDTAVSRRAFDKSQADAEEARQAAAKLEDTMKNYETRVNQWYQENDAKLKQVQNQAVAAAAEAARHKAALLEAQKQGMIELAKGAGYDVEPEKPNTPAAPDERYIQRDQFMQAVDQVGANLAALEDMVMEHRQLFPDTPLRVSDLRREAMASGKQVVQYWEEKYKVPSARESAAAKQRDAEIAKWKAEGAKEKETELISRLGNPDMRPLVPSKSPFAVRPDDKLRADNQPWNKSETQLQNDRIARATQKLAEKQSSGIN